jgi:predicted GIY-YIG superfamily endonuclease
MIQYFILRPGEPAVLSTFSNIISGRIVKDYHYVYIIVSKDYPDKHYTGLTGDIESRLKAHNAGQVSYTSKYRPWTIETAVAFRSKEKAATFEKYLKTHSGRAFASKHF